MSMGTLASRILGMARDMVLASLFSKTATDAFVVAFRLPNMFRRLLGEGSLSVSFIPVYVEKRTQDEAKAKPLANAVFTLLNVVTSSLTVLGIVFMPKVLQVLVSGKGFVSIPGKLELTILLARIMFVYLFLVTNFAYFMAILNAHKKFFIAAFAPALFNFVFIAFAFLPKQWAPYEGWFAAWGVVAGGVTQFLLVAHALMKLGWLPRLCWNFKVDGFKAILLNMVPGMLGLGILQLMSIVNIVFASRLPEGTHSYIYWADRIFELPQSLFAISLGTALLPTLSELWSEGRAEKMRSVGQKGVRLLLFLALPSAVGLYVLAQPIIELIYLRGNFNVRDATQTAEVLQLYCYLLVASSFVKVLVPSFYAIKNTWVPALISAICLLFHVILANFLTNIFGLQGLVGSTVATGFLNMILLLACYFYFVGSFDFKILFESVLRMTPALVAMGLFCHYFYQFTHGSLNNWLPGVWSNAIVVVVCIVIASFIYFYICDLFKVPEFEPISSRLKRKFKLKKIIR